jgi:hypothetical protein
MLCACLGLEIRDQKLEIGRNKEFVEEKVAIAMAIKG